MEIEISGQTAVIAQASFAGVVIDKKCMSTAAGSARPTLRRALTFTPCLAIARCALLMLLTTGSFAQSTAAESVPAETVVRTAVDAIFGAIKTSGGDPQSLRSALERAVGPRLDPLQTAQVALGQYWRDASAPERARVAAGIRRMVLDGLATALQGHPDARVDVIAARQHAEPDEITVRTRVHASGGRPIPIDYRLQRNDGVWKVYDFSIEGVSMLTSYRRSFTSRVRRVGLPAFIEELERR